MPHLTRFISYAFGNTLKSLLGFGLGAIFLTPGVRGAKTTLKSVPPDDFELQIIAPPRRMMGMNKPMPDRGLVRVFISLDQASR
jgi:hypothetical protein